jgi:anti-anti-sigma factor
MNVKIDTKKKFHVITIQASIWAANMTEELKEILLKLREKDVKNVILNCKDIENFEIAAAEALVNVQHMYYEQKDSFIICELGAKVEDSLDEMGLLELMNTTTTESEAYDIVHMEEIERELWNEEEE